MRHLRRAVALALATVVLALLGAQVAHAAGLSFSAARPGFFATSLARCSDAAVTVAPGAGTGNQRSGLLLTVPASCAGTDGYVLLVRGNGNPVASAARFTVPVGFPGGTLTVPYGNAGNPAQYNAATVAGAVLTLDTWRIRTAWTFAAAVEPITPTTAGTVVSQHSWATQAATAFCVAFRITNTSTAPVAWVLDIDLAQAPFNVPAGTSIRSDRYNLTSGTTQLQPVRAGTTTSQAVAAPSPYTVTGGHLLLQGAGWQPTRVLAAGASTTATICDPAAPSPAVVEAGSTTYSVAQAASVQNHQLCVTTTITGLTKPTSTGLVPFVGWRADVDWAAAVQQAAAAGSISAAQATTMLGRTLTSWSNVAPSSRWGSYAGTALTSSAYRLVGTDTWNTASIAGGMTLSAQACQPLG
ncbi:hypothetical protein ACTHAM_002173 [Cellulomonas soli]|uniref:hypothetical protein n=1 Tax=Cellulomonas soli TaxID=931535 RepID=UPI003F8296E0